MLPLLLFASEPVTLLCRYVFGGQLSRRIEPPRGLGLRLRYRHQGPANLATFAEIKIGVGSEAIDVLPWCYIESSPGQARMETNITPSDQRWVASTRGV